MAGKKKYRNLNKEDQFLWKKVTENVKPLEGKSFDLKQNFEELFEKQDKARINKSPIFLEKNKNISKIISNTNAPPLKQKKQLVSPVPYLDKKAKSRLARGIKHIEAKLDLHGLTQKQAYQALLSFLENSQNKNLKNVLVITGKGSQLSLNNRNDFFSINEEPGVLRRKLPDWLHTEKLKQFISHFDEAAPNHGGSGAFYIVIRKRG